MKHLTKEVLANAFALTTAVSWVLCSGFVAVFPKLSWRVTKWWLHGVKIDRLGGFHLTFNNFLLGGITMAVSFWVVGYILGWSLELLTKNK